MLSLEQVKLLDQKVARAVEYVERVSGENALLRKKLNATQKRIDELEHLVSQFKEEQGRIEDGILSALDRLSQFESAIEKSLAGRGKETKPAPVESVIPENSPGRIPATESAPDIQDPLEEEDDEDSEDNEDNDGDGDGDDGDYSGDEADSDPSDNGELDIF